MKAARTIRRQRTGAKATVVAVNGVAERGPASDFSPSPNDDPNNNELEADGDDAPYVWQDFSI